MRAHGTQKTRTEATCSHKTKTQAHGQQTNNQPCAKPDINTQLMRKLISHCNKVRRKEGIRTGLAREDSGVFINTDKLTQVRTLRHPDTSTLSVVSAITLCIRSGCFSLTARAPESSLRLSP